LRECDGRVAGPDGAAARLGVKPTTLYSRIKAFDLTENDWRAPRWGHGIGAQVRSP
jgi:hypothetical protein